MKMKKLILSLLILFSAKLTKGDQNYAYSSMTEIRQLDSYGFNPDNPLDAIRIMQLNALSPINIYAGFHGISRILQAYDLQLEDLLNLAGARSRMQNLTSESKAILDLVKNLGSSSKNKDVLLCQIQDFAMMPSRNKELVCGFVYVNPISRFKVETSHDQSPKILLIHDYETPHERQYWLQNLDHSNTFHIASIYGHETNQLIDPIDELEQLLSYEREGQIGFLDQDIHTLKAELKLTTLLEAMKYRSPMTYESYQFGTYGIGGYIGEHLDTYGTPEQPLDFEKADRYLTALTYLQGSWTQGGATIFPNLGIGVPLQAGNLLLWENLEPSNNHPLKDALHKSCPVIYGSKVVLNKWIHLADFTPIPSW